MQLFRPHMFRTLSRETFAKSLHNGAERITPMQKKSNKVSVVFHIILIPPCQEKSYEIGLTNEAPLSHICGCFGMRYENKNGHIFRLNPQIFSIYAD